MWQNFYANAILITDTAGRLAQLFHLVKSIPIRYLGRNIEHAY